jgi:hypothetical protein
MNTTRIVLLGLLVCLAPIFGGEIYGTIKEGGRPVGRGLKVEITKGTDGAPAYSADTDDFGNYRVIVPEIGKFVITIQVGGKKTNPGEIQSYPTSVRFDWVLEKTGETYSLKRQ